MVKAPKRTGCFGRNEVRYFPYATINSVLVCMYDPDNYPPNVYSGFEEVLFVPIWDTTGTTPGHPPATETDLRNIYNFIKQHWDKNVFASCEAGVSRSAAVRSFLLDNGWSYYHASQSMRPVYPNPHIRAGLRTLHNGGQPYVWPMADVNEAPQHAGPNGG